MNVLPSVLPLFLTKRFKFWTIAFHSQLNFTIGKHIRELVYSGIFLSPTTLLERKSWSLYDFSNIKFFPYVKFSGPLPVRDREIPVVWISKLKFQKKIPLGLQSSEIYNLVFLHWVRCSLVSFRIEWTNYGASINMALSTPGNWVEAYFSCGSFICPLRFYRSEHKQVDLPSKFWMQINLGRPGCRPKTSKNSLHGSYKAALDRAIVLNNDRNF